MRGGKSFLILVVLRSAWARTSISSRSKRDPADASLKKDKTSSRSTPPKSKRSKCTPRPANVTTLKKNGALWQIVAPETLTPTRRKSARCSRRSSTLEVQRDARGEARVGGGLRARSAAAHGRVPGRRRDGDATPAHRQQDADGRRSLCAGSKASRSSSSISAYVEDSLNKTPFGLRDKSVAEVRARAVDSLTLETLAGAPVALRQEGHGLAASPSPGRQGRFRRRGRPRRPSCPVANEVGRPSSRRRHGRPQEVRPRQAAELVATLGAGSTRATLAIGGKADDTTVYARDLSRPIVFTVEKSLLDDLKKKPEDLRKKDLFEFRTFTRPAGPRRGRHRRSRSTRKKAGGKEQSSAGDVWKQTEAGGQGRGPGEDDRPADDALQPARRHVRGQGRSRPARRLTVTAHFGDAAAPQTEKVRFRKSGTIVHAILPGEAGAPSCRRPISTRPSRCQGTDRSQVRHSPRPRSSSSPPVRRPPDRLRRSSPPRRAGSRRRSPPISTTSLRPRRCTRARRHPHRVARSGRVLYSRERATSSSCPPRT